MNKILLPIIGIVFGFLIVGPMLEPKPINKTPKLEARIIALENQIKQLQFDINLANQKTDTAYKNSQTAHILIKQLGRIITMEEAVKQIADVYKTP
jgi:hypothetical protein